MVPFIGAGAGQGFEDVYALWRFLTHPKVTKSNLSVSRHDNQPFLQLVFYYPY